MVDGERLALACVELARQQLRDVALADAETADFGIAVRASPVDAEPHERAVASAASDLFATAFLLTERLFELWSRAGNAPIGNVGGESALSEVLYYLIATAERELSLARSTSPGDAADLQRDLSVALVAHAAARLSGVADDGRAELERRLLRESAEASSAYGRPARPLSTDDREAILRIGGLVAGHPLERFVARLDERVTGGRLSNSFGGERSELALFAIELYEASAAVGGTLRKAGLLAETATRRP